MYLILNFYNRIECSKFFDQIMFYAEMKEKPTTKLCEFSFILIICAHSVQSVNLSFLLMTALIIFDGILIDVLSKNEVKSKMLNVFTIFTMKSEMDSLFFFCAEAAYQVNRM